MTVRAHCQVTTFDATSNAVMTSATVNVYTPGTVTPISATIYDRLGNPLSNPLTSDATTGLCDFYLLVAQEVDLVVSKAAFTTRTYSNVPVLDDSSLELTALLTTTGDMVYASSANTPVRLAVGSTNYTVTVAGGIPKWTSALQVSDAGGGVAIGAGVGTDRGLYVTGAITSTGATQYGIVSTATVTSAATTKAVGLYVDTNTAAASFICTTAASIEAATPAAGAGSTITNGYGLLVDAITAGGTNNYGVYVNTPSGGSGVNVAIQALGDCALGSNSIANSSTTGFPYIPVATGTPTGTPVGVSGYAPMRYDNSAHKIWVYDSGWKGVVVS